MEATALIDRDKERSILDELVADARSGSSRALVLAGEAGIGKTVLLDYACARATDLGVVRSVGIEAEVGYPFGALHRLLIPFLDLLPLLAPSPRTALEVAFGITDGPPASALRVGSAALAAFAEIARNRPLLVCIDDVQWIDLESLSALAFVGRRLHAEGIALVLAVRDSAGALRALDGLPVLNVDRLDRTSALALLDRVLDHPIDPQIADRVVHATAGNPLALNDLGAYWSTQPSIDAAPTDPVPLGPQLQAHYLAMVESLPEDTQAWLTVAAVEPSGDLVAVSRAAEALSIPPGASAPAEALGIVTVRTTIAFRHPLVRSAIYGGATSVARRAAHEALANVLTDDPDHDRRLWHLAAATVGPDDQIADLLAVTALRARQRGGFAASSDVLARSAALSTDTELRNSRMLAAADAAMQGGLPHRAQELLQRLDPYDVTPSDSGYALLLATEINLQIGVPGAFAIAAARDLEAARLVMGDDVAAVHHALLRAAHHAVIGEHLLRGASAADVAREILATDADGGDSVDARVLDAFAGLALNGYELAAPQLHAAVAALAAPTPSEGRAWFRDLLGVTFTMMLWDYESQAALLARMGDRARAFGATRDLDTVLYCQTMFETCRGDLVNAMRFLAEGQETRAALGATDTQWDIYRHPELLAWRGELDDLSDVLGVAEQASEELGSGSTAAIAHVARVIDALGRGWYAEAAEVASALIARDELGVQSRVLPDLVEAAERSGNRGLAESTLSRLHGRATASGTPVALGLLTRSAALLAPPAEAETLYVDAIEQLSATDAPADAARARLLYGEWLRRSRERKEARAELRAAYEHFSDMGATSFAERARAELAATGERARRRTVETWNELTPQELQVARLAADGDTNAEIAEKLYISSRTVDYHLRKVFRKLEVGSRRDLRGRFG